MPVLVVWQSTWSRQASIIHRSLSELAMMNEAVFASISTYCAAWNEADTSVREGLLESSCTPSIRYVDPNVDLAGLDELSSHIGRMLADRPGYHIRLGPRVIQHPAHALFDWTLIDFDGQTRRRGIDYCELSASSRLRVVVGFFLDER